MTSEEATYAQPRRVPRVRVSIPATYASAGLQLTGRVTDISTEGCFFSAQFLDGRGEFAEIQLEMPAPEAPLQLRGEVRWVRDTPRGGGMGIKLVDVALDSRIKLAALVVAARDPDTFVSAPVTH